MTPMLLPLGSEFTKSLSSQPNLLAVFKDYFDTVVFLAGTNRENGHLHTVPTPTSISISPTTVTGGTMGMSSWARVVETLQYNLSPLFSGQ